MRVHSAGNDRFGRFGFLLAALVLFLLTAPIVGQSTLAEIRFRTLFLLVLLVGVYTMSERRQFVVGGVLTLLAFVAGTVDTLTEGITAARAAYVLGTAFLCYVAGVVLMAVLRSPRVTPDTISGGICVYLLAGIAWALLYALVLTFDPDAILYAGSPVQPELDRGSPLLLYFSFVTLTTLGYGDVAPHADQARVLAATEAVFGQLFIAVLIARLVGMQISSPSGDASS